MALAADSGIGTRADADALQTEAAPGSPRNGLAQKPVSRNTPVTEREVNAFLRAHASEACRRASSIRSVTILADGHLRRAPWWTSTDPQLQGARHVQPVDDSAGPCAG